MNPELPRGNAELHLHLEGSVPLPVVVELAAARSHPWGALTPAMLKRFLRFESFLDFLKAIRETCIVLASLEGLERAACELSLFLRRHGVLYAEVYSSPYIFVRWGMDYGEVLRAVDRGFTRGEEEGGARCVILLDSVRQWGPDAAAIVLGEFEKNRTPRVVGFGMGGEEIVPLEDFAGIYDQARALGLRTVVHAGELGPLGDVRKAIEVLRVDRIAHGIRALDDPRLIDQIIEAGVALDLAITSNYKTRAASGIHPIRDLLDAGVTVTLSTDDAALFQTTLPREYRRAARFGRLSHDELRQLARNAIDCSFADEETKRWLHEDLVERKEERGERKGARPE